MRSVVDLPQPDGPSSSTSLPESVAKLAPSTALAVPQCLLTRSRRSCIRLVSTPHRGPCSRENPRACRKTRTRGAIVRARVAWPSDERSGAAKTLCYIGKTARFRAIQGARMSAAKPVREYQESRIEDEPILGAVLVLPSGTIQPLTWWERVLVALRLTDAKALEARYFNLANP